MRDKQEKSPRPPWCDMNNLYDKILLTIAQHTLAPKRTLLLMTHNRYYVDQVLSAAESDGMIKSEILKMADGKESNAKEEYFKITPKGLRYLLSSNSAPWLSTVTYDNKLPSPLGGLSIDEPIKRRMLMTSMCAMMVETAGGEVELPVHGVLGTEKYQNKTIAGLLGIAESSYRRGQNENEEYDLEEIRFTDTIHVRDMIARSQSIENDTKFGRQVGIIDSHFKSVLCYAPPANTFQTNSHYKRRENATMTQWVKRFGMESAAELLRHGTASILFVKHESQFRAIALDEDGKVKKDISEGINHLYVIPFTKEGKKHLRWLMLTDDQDINTEFITNMIESGQFKKNEEWYKDVFPLVSVSDGTVYATTLQFDLPHLNRIATRISQMDGEPTGILCFKWQQPYMEALFPESKILTLR